MGGRCLQVLEEEGGGDEVGTGRMDVLSEEGQSPEGAVAPYIDGLRH